MTKNEPSDMELEAEARKFLPRVDSAKNSVWKVIVWKEVSAVIVKNAPISPKANDDYYLLTFEKEWNFLKGIGTTRKWEFWKLKSIQR